MRVSTNTVGIMFLFARRKEQKQKNREKYSGSKDKPLFHTVIFLTFYR